MLNRKPVYSDLFPALLILALSIYIIAVAIPWELYGLLGPGPGFFPLLYGVLMLLLSGALLVRSLSGRRIVRQKLDEESVEEEPGSTSAAMFAWGALALSIPLMYAFGFLIGFGLLTFYLVKVTFDKPLLNSAVTAVLLTAGLYLVFQMLLEVDLPVGAWTGF